MIATIVLLSFMAAVSVIIDITRGDQ